jgi:hypothetical protein
MYRLAYSVISGVYSSGGMEIFLEGTSGWIDVLPVDNRVVFSGLAFSAAANYIWLRAGLLRHFVESVSGFV